jgi:hypothetical protein
MKITAEGNGATFNLGLVHTTTCRAIPTNKQMEDQRYIVYFSQDDSGIYENDHVDHPVV